MDYWKVFEEEEGVEVDLGAVEEDGVEVLEVIYVDLEEDVIMVVGGDNRFCGVHGIIGHVGRNFGLCLVIVNVVARLMVVLFQEQGLMTVFGLLIVIVVGMCTMVEHKKTH
jgi:hypothetical protein|tara:strand:- start:117 stop:449 length:333 start_codon:yes stop_codon:yes gene_type:complete